MANMDGQMNNPNQQEPTPFPELDRLAQAAQKATDRVEKLRLMAQWIEKAKVIQATGQGKIQQLETQRVQEYGCPDDQQAQEMIKELETSVAALEKELEDGTAVLMEEMGWANG